MTTIVLLNVPDQVAHAIEDTARVVTESNLRRGGQPITVEQLIVAALCRRFDRSYNGPEATLNIEGE